MALTSLGAPVEGGGSDQGPSILTVLCQPVCSWPFLLLQQEEGDHLASLSESLSWPLAELLLISKVLKGSCVLWVQTEESKEDLQPSAWRPGCLVMPTRP